MQQRKRKTRFPCPRCGLNPQLCICELIPKLTLQTRLLLVVHAKELKRTTNSGRLALEALNNSAMKIRGVIGEDLDLTDQLTPEYHSLLFFPSENAIELTHEFRQTIQKPVQLIVPDGSWRQAAKVQVRHTELAGLTRVMITEKNTARHHLRNESTSFGMSTLESIAKAFLVLEGAAAGQALKSLYEAKLNATLKGRGVISD